MISRDVNFYRRLSDVQWHHIGMAVNWSYWCCCCFCTMVKPNFSVKFILIIYGYTCFMVLSCFHLLVSTCACISQIFIIHTYIIIIPWNGHVVVAAVEPLLHPDERTERKNTEKQLIVIMNNLSKTNDALRMIMEPNMEIGISYLMRRLNCIATGNVFPNSRTHHCRMSTHTRTSYTLWKRILICLTNNNMVTIHNGTAPCVRVCTCVDWCWCWCGPWLDQRIKSCFAHK